LMTQVSWGFRISGNRSSAATAFIPGDHARRLKKRTVLGAHPDAPQKAENIGKSREIPWPMSGDLALTSRAQRHHDRLDLQQRQPTLDGDLHRGQSGRVACLCRARQTGP
jgi:hypothetical protein